MVRALSQTRPAKVAADATLEAVATAAGVSRATVSRVVNGSTRVDPTTRKAVEHAIRRLRYVPNRAARSLVTRRTDSVAAMGVAGGRGGGGRDLNFFLFKKFTIPYRRGGPRAASGLTSGRIPA